MLVGFMMVWNLPLDKYDPTINKYMLSLFECKITYRRSVFDKNYLLVKLKEAYEQEPLEVEIKQRRERIN